MSILAAQLLSTESIAASSQYFWRYGPQLITSVDSEPTGPTNPGEVEFNLRSSALPVAYRAETSQSNHFSFDFADLLSAPDVSGDTISFRLEPFSAGEALPDGFALSGSVLQGITYADPATFSFRVSALGQDKNGKSLSSTKAYSLTIEDRIDFNLVEALTSQPIKRIDYSLNLTELVDQSSLSGIDASVLGWEWKINPNPTGDTMPSLPTGINLVGSKLIGTPSNSGKYDVVITASFDGRKKSRNYLMDIGLPLTAIDFTQSTPPIGEIGTPYSLDLKTLVTTQNIQPSQIRWSVNSPADTESGTVEGLPSGLALNTNTGLIFGTPSTKGDYRFEINALWEDTQPEAERVESSETFEIKINGFTYRYTQMALAFGGSHTCGVTPAGGVQCWGSGSNGKLGNGSTAYSYLPVDVSGISSEIKAVATGDEFTCVLTVGGSVKCWGQGSSGQLGNGASSNSVIPVDVTGMSSGVTAIQAGKDFACGLLSTGIVKCWGGNADGQLGNGLTSPSNVPVTVSGLSGIKQISTSTTNACALLSAGNVKCWGANTWGQLGNDSTTASSTPVDVVNLGSSISEISVGAIHSCALTDTGGVKCWGYNGGGRLGNGTTANSRVPVDVVGLSYGVSTIGASNNSTCAILNDGSAKCWGANGTGQLGTGTAGANSTIPVSVPSITSGASKVYGGNSYFCAIMDDSSAKCWGSNTNGRLGIGTAVDTYEPANVGG